MNDTHVFETPGSVSLQIKLPSGRVVVTTADQPRTTVELIPIGRRGPDALEGIDVRAEQRGDGHVIVIDEKDARGRGHRLSLPDRGRTPAR